LGYAVALGLAREGASVAINSRDAENLSRSAQNIHQETGMDVQPAPGDVADPNFTQTILTKAIERLGGLDILITNAGGPPSGAFEKLNDEAWLSAVQLNLLSHVRLIRAALPELRRSASASVLTVTSYSVKQAIPNLVLSNSIRMATVGLTKTLASELGREGIRFNSILPGVTDTDRMHELIETRAKNNKTTFDQELQKQLLEIPLGRMATPEEFANVAVFLVSPAASYINGVMMQVDGGFIKSTF
jgi:3-oxoacyl-[acyl-carrier protein] reductase